MIVGSLLLLFLDNVEIIEHFGCQSPEVCAIVAMYFILTCARHCYYCLEQ